MHGGIAIYGKNWWLSSVLWYILENFLPWKTGEKHRKQKSCSTATQDKK